MLFLSVFPLLLNFWECSTHHSNMIFCKFYKNVLHANNRDNPYPNYPSHNTNTTCLSSLVYNSDTPLFPSSFLKSLPQTGQKLNCSSLSNFVLHSANKILASYFVTSAFAVEKSNFLQNSHILFIFLSRLHNSYFISTHNKNISIIKFLLINLFSVIVAI